MFLCVVIAGKANAAPVSIDSLFIDTASATVTLEGFGTTTFSETFMPIEVTMGVYQDPIFSIVNGPSSAADTLTIYSSDINSIAAPSGFVDGTFAEVDFSSLRMTLDAPLLGLIIDTGLWPINTGSDFGTYDSGTDLFSLGWATDFTYGEFGELSGSVIVELGGNLTTVPVPAAVWLFGSGLVALFGIRRRKSI